MNHGDGGKGSSRRNEDVSKVKSNWDLIDWSVTTSKKTQEEHKMNEVLNEHDEDYEDNDVDSRAADDYEDCSWCSGSGEGMYDGSNCKHCGGSGVEPYEGVDDDYV